MRIWFHGTDRFASQAISEQGFRAGSWFAKSLQDAIEFGGEYVFEVALDYRPIHDGNWQMCISDEVPASAIVALIRYKITKLMDRPEMRAKVLCANQQLGKPS